MKNRLLKVMVVLCMLFYVVESCQKNSNAPAGATSSQSLATAISSLQAIAVGTTSSSASAADSIYVIRACAAHSKKDTIAFSSLPSGVTNYLNSNYAGYTSQQAYAITDSSGAAAGYIVIIQYNNSPVGLKFDASGNFISVLEKRLGRELEACVGGDSTYTHHGHPYDSTHVDDHDSTHILDSTHIHGEANDSTHYNDGDSTHHHHH